MHRIATCRQAAEARARPPPQHFSRHRICGVILPTKNAAQIVNRIDSSCNLAYHDVEYH